MKASGLVDLLARVAVQATPVHRSGMAQVLRVMMAVVRWHTRRCSSGLPPAVVLMAAVGRWTVSIGVAAVATIVVGSGMADAGRGQRDGGCERDLRCSVPWFSVV